LELSSRLDFDIQWRPVLVGAVWNANNQGAYARRMDIMSDPRRAQMALRDVGEWAKLRGANIRGMHPNHPVNAARLMRASYSALEQDAIIPFARAAFHAYWRDFADVSQANIVLNIAQTAGLDIADLAERMDSEPRRAQLKSNTQDLIDRGGLGTPTFFIKDDMYFGQDRLPLIEARLREMGARP
jgi:2-hydroxychromene-2-carboxylate isomerase